MLEPVDVAELRESLQKAIAAKLGMLIPPGGRLWIAYEAQPLQSGGSTDAG